MSLQIMTEDYPGVSTLAWVTGSSKFKGIITSGKTKEEAVEELFVSIRVKFSYDYGIPIEEVAVAEIEDGYEIKIKING